MVYREDYIHNRVQRVEQNLAFLKELYLVYQDQYLKESIQRVFREYLELSRIKSLLDENKILFGE